MNPRRVDCLGFFFYGIRCFNLGFAQECLLPAQQARESGFLLEHVEFNNVRGVGPFVVSHCGAVGSECSRKKRSISLAASGPRGSV